MLHIKLTSCTHIFRLVTGTKRGSNSTTCIDDKEGNIIMEKEKLLYRSYEYIGELYNDDRGDMPKLLRR